MVTAKRICENKFIEKTLEKKGSMTISISSYTSGDAMSNKRKTSSSDVAMILSRVSVLGNMSP